MGKFLNSKAPDDEQLLAKLVTHQTRGMWDAMAGRTDQVSSGAASALDSMALTSVKRGGTSSGWDGVYALLDGGGAGDADGACLCLYICMFYPHVYVYIHTHMYL